MQRFAKPYNREVELVRLQYDPPIFERVRRAQSEDRGTTTNPPAVICSGGMKMN